MPKDLIRHGLAMIGLTGLLLSIYYWAVPSLPTVLQNHTIQKTDRSLVAQQGIRNFLKGKSVQKISFQVRGDTVAFKGFFLTETDFLSLLSFVFQNYSVRTFSFKQINAVSKKNLRRLSQKKLSHFFEGRICLVSK